MRGDGCCPLFFCLFVTFHDVDDDPKDDDYGRGQRYYAANDDDDVASVSYVMHRKSNDGENDARDFYGPMMTDVMMADPGGGDKNKRCVKINGCEQKIN